MLPGLECLAWPFYGLCELHQEVSGFFILTSNNLGTFRPEFPGKSYPFFRVPLFCPHQLGDVLVQDLPERVETAFLDWGAILFYRFYIQDALDLWPGPLFDYTSIFGLLGLGFIVILVLEFGLNGGELLGREVLHLTVYRQ